MQREEEPVKITKIARGNGFVLLKRLSEHLETEVEREEITTTSSTFFFLIVSSMPPQSITPNHHNTSVSPPTFSRAFYKGQASYWVIPLWLIVFYNTCWQAISTWYVC